MKTFIITTLFTVLLSGYAHAESFGPQHDIVQKLFKSDKEPTAKDAIWTAKHIFKVGVIDDGSNRDGYAQYVCLTLNEEYGFKRKGIWVHIIDIVKLARDGRWIKLGDKRCDR